MANTLRSDQQSIADSLSMNKTSRVLDGVNEFPDLRSAHKPYLIIMKGSTELGCAEHGKEDNNGIDSKEVYERRLKLPKILKSMLNQLCCQTQSAPPRIIPRYGRRTVDLPTVGPTGIHSGPAEIPAEEYKIPTGGLP